MAEETMEALTEKDEEQAPAIKENKRLKRMERRIARKRRRIERKLKKIPTERAFDTLKKEIDMGDDIKMITFGIAAGDDALYMAMVQAVHEDQVRRQIMEAEKLCIFVFGDVSIEDVDSVIAEIEGIPKKAPTVSFQAMPGNGLIKQQVAIAIGTYC